MKSAEKGFKLGDSITGISAGVGKARSLVSWIAPDKIVLLSCMATYGPG